MPKLYIEEYGKTLKGKTVLIACREGILRDHFSDIAADVKFVSRQGIHTLLYHNLPNRFANQKHFRKLQERLPRTRIVRIPPEQGFYAAVLKNGEKAHKLIFLERKYLTDLNGRKLNALTTRKARMVMERYGSLVSNTGFEGIIDQICRKIEAGLVDRVHIVPAGRHKIKHELFAIEGSGTLIANDFSEAFSRISSGKETRIVYDILRRYQREGFLKPRSRQYIEAHHRSFFVAKIDGIIVGCLEKRTIDARAVELGALAISGRYRNQQIGFFLVNAFLREARQQGFREVVSLTRNAKLARLYRALGFQETADPRFRARQEASPGVPMYRYAFP